MLHIYKEDAEKSAFSLYYIMLSWHVKIFKILLCGYVCGCQGVGLVVTEMCVKKVKNRYEKIWRFEKKSYLCTPFEKRVC